MNEPIILSALGFIFGWITSRVDYKRKMLAYLSSINFELKASNKAFQDGMDLGAAVVKDYVIECVTNNKIGKKFSIKYSNKNNNKD